MGTQAIDAATFRELQQAAGEDFVAELVATYLEEAPKMLASLRSALAAGDVDAFRRAAHSLKSNSLTFGAQGLAGLARTLETTAKEVVERADAGVVAPLEAEQQRVAVALRELAHG
jgi:HPt (histidine-containing phosphotransfer) domain-containing protein